MLEGEAGVDGVRRLKSFPADMTTCRGVPCLLERTSRWRGVEGVTGSFLEVGRDLRGLSSSPSSIESSGSIFSSS